MATLSEFDFEIRYIKGKENKDANAFSRRMLVNHIGAMSSYGIELQEQILQVGQQDDKYQQLKHRLQQ